MPLGDHPKAAKDDRNRTAMDVLTAQPLSAIVQRMAHGKWSEVEARGVLEAWQRSGLPLEKFARQRGFVAQRLRWWRAKFKRVDKAMLLGSVPAVLPVQVSREDSRRGEPVTVLLRTGHMLKVSHGFDESAFARVVALLEGG